MQKTSFRVWQSRSTMDLPEVPGFIKESLNWPRKLHATSQHAGHSLPEHSGVSGVNLAGVPAAQMGHGSFSASTLQPTVWGLFGESKPSTTEMQLISGSLTKHRSSGISRKLLFATFLRCNGDPGIFTHQTAQAPKNSLEVLPNSRLQAPEILTVERSTLLGGTCYPTGSEGYGSVIRPLQWHSLFVYYGT